MAAKTASKEHSQRNTTWRITTWIQACVVLALLALILLPAPARAADADSWEQVAEEMSQILDDAQTAYLAGDIEAGKDLVNTAYYRRYETLGFEKQVMARISGERVSTVEMEFSLVKRAMNEHDDAGVAQHTSALKNYLREDAATLDGKGSSDGASDDYSPGPWGQVAKEMGQILDDAQAAYLAGDIEAGKDLVNTAYYRRYETLGFEKQVMARISGERVSTVEMEFSLVKRTMNEHDDAGVAQHTSALKNYLREDANSLDGYTSASSATSPWLSGFLPSLLVILREGMEVILVVAAILAYLTKAGHKDKAKVVWIGVVLALVASVLLAFLFSAFANLAGANQELLEGLAALFAVAMLIWVSNWMVSKSSNEAWDRYIKDQTDASLTRGSLLGLTFIAFLAVLREGAETILFYVPIISNAQDSLTHVWIGLGVGVLILLVVYLLIQFAALRIPLRPFFTVTSILLALMAVTFTGSGIKELQEADVLPLTYLQGFPTIDLLGIYPRVENLSGQALVLVVIVGLYLWGRKRRSGALAAK